MPRLFVPLRHRKYALGLEKISKEHRLSFLSSHTLWEDFNAWVYLLGGLAFIVGSVFFLPSLENLEAAGCWLFTIASIFWLVVSLHDFAELGYFHGRHPPKIDVAAALSYISGSALFIAGSALFLPTVGEYDGGAVCFIVGSLLFVIGAMINGLQIFEAKTCRDAQCMLLMALFYVVGSCFFLVASVPYLLETDLEKLDFFLAGIFVAGSICFTVGGIVNFRRARILRKLLSDLHKLKDEESNGAQPAEQSDGK
ncbi:hypothetical protein ACHAXT_009144 [Thalassiosira profunda]